VPAASTEPAATTIIGVVGFTPVLDPYPLGPRLMAELEVRCAGMPEVSLRNMTWSPIHIVQQFEDMGADLPDRIVLVGAASVCACPGRVRAWRWSGGCLPDAAMQERIYEAVTGVVDLENTLMIGEKFGIWPTKCYTVEAELPAETFGTMVMAETRKLSSASLVRGLGFDPALTIARLAATATCLARGDDRDLAGLKQAADLVPVTSFHHATTTGPAPRRQSQ